jgi:hypothetical protein
LGRVFYDHGDHPERIHGSHLDVKCEHGALGSGSIVYTRHYVFARATQFTFDLPRFNLLNGQIFEHKLQLTSGWINFAERVPSYVLGRVITTGKSGLVEAGKWGHIASLPEGQRPASALNFAVNTHGTHSRLDIGNDGRIHCRDQGQAHQWLSLEGIRFTVTGGAQLGLNNGWVNYGEGNAPAEVHTDGEVVQLSGTIRNGNKKHIATLADGLRPPARLVFSANSAPTFGHSRMDVLANGEVHVQTPTTGWVSLNNICFSIGNGTRAPLTLASGWVDYGGEYATAQVHAKDNVVTLSGLIKGGSWGHIATLSEGHRPAARLVFCVNNHEKQSRVDACADGKVLWVAGGHNHSWISLTGIRFRLPKPFRREYGLAPGAKVCVDREFTFSEVKEPLLGASFIQWSMNQTNNTLCKGGKNAPSSANEHKIAHSFRVPVDCRLFVLCIGWNPQADYKRHQKVWVKTWDIVTSLLGDYDLMTESLAHHSAVVQIPTWRAKRITAAGSLVELDWMLLGHSVVMVPVKTVVVGEGEQYQKIEEGLTELQQAGHGGLLMIRPGVYEPKGILTVTTCVELRAAVTSDGDGAVKLVGNSHDAIRFIGSNACGEVSGLTIVNSAGQSWSSHQRGCLGCASGQYDLQLQVDCRACAW